jgi:serine protease Do
MKKVQRFLINLFIFYLCCAFFISLMAQENLPAIVKRVEPSTVVILTYDAEEKLIGQGSGFFVSQNGDVITNRHVLLGAVHAEVKTLEGKIYPITRIVAEDNEADIIRVSVDIPLKHVKPLSVSGLIPEAGERIIIIGNPLGLERTVTDGIISSVREILGFGKIIQITAPISSGSSGSPVVNMHGEVIGIATFQIVEGQNLNFAIPGERIAKLTPGKGRTLVEWQKIEKEEWFTSAEELYSTGRVFAWIEDYEKALSYFKKAVAKKPQYEEAYLCIGYCNIKLGHYTEAIEATEKAIRIKPDYAKAHMALGLIYGWELRRYNEAIEALKQAIRIEPEFAAAHCTLGIIYLLQGDRGSALEEYKILKDLDRDLANKLFNLIYK